jgi:hypothetical protein
MNSKELYATLNQDETLTFTIEGRSISTQWAIYHSYIFPKETFKLVRVQISRNNSNTIYNVKPIGPFTNLYKVDPRSVKTICKGLTTCKDIYKGLTSFKKSNLYMAQYLFVDTKISL